MATDLDLAFAGQVLHDIMCSLVALGLGLQIHYLLLHASQFGQLGLDVGLLELSLLLLLLDLGLGASALRADLEHVGTCAIGDCTTKELGLRSTTQR